MSSGATGSEWLSAMARDNGSLDLGEVLRDLRSAHGRLRAVMGPLARTLGRQLVDAAQQIRRAVPPDAWANVRHFVDERDDALARRERWVAQLHECAVALGQDNAPPWERVAMFWMRLYGLHDLREQVDAEATTDAERAILVAIDTTCSKLTPDEWEGVRFIRNNEAHPWAESHGVRWRNSGPTFEVRSFGGEVFHVRELAVRRQRLDEAHGGELGYARAVARLVEGDLPPLISALKGQRNESR